MSQDAAVWVERGQKQLQNDDYEAALFSFEQAIALTPNLPDAWEGKGLALQKLGRYGEAIAANDTARELYNPSVALQQAIEAVQIANAWLERGKQQYIVGDFENAISSYDQVLGIKPDAHQAWNNRGLALRSLERYEEAIASFDKAVMIKPDDHYAWYNRGITLVNLERYEEAITSLDKAVAIKPDHHEAWCYQGVALGNLERHEEAIASFDKAVAIKPDYHYAWYDRGVALVNLERYEEAITSHGKAVAIKPDAHYAWKNRGVALVDVERYEEAITSFDKAVAIKPDYHEAWDNRGAALGKLERYEEAIASFDKAVAIKPDYHEAWDNRGVGAGNSRECKTPVVFSLPPTMQNPDLDRRGYEGALASYREGLKYVQRETDPQGWGKLHRAIGRAHYFEGCFDSNADYYYRQALTSYQTALPALKPFLEAYLKLIQDLIRVYLGLGDRQAANVWREQGLQVFGELLNATPSPGRKRRLEFQFSGFSQIAVDVPVQNGQLTAALEAADRYKNRCLTWILEEWKEQVISPSYAEMQQLLNDTTAAIYWHLSPDAVTTFVLKADQPEPILVTPYPVTRSIQNCLRSLGQRLGPTLQRLSRQEKGCQ